MFQYKEVFTDEEYQEINEIKTFYPEIIEIEADRRAKKTNKNKMLVFAAADHNARMIQAYKGNPFGLSDRREYLSRLVRILCSDEVDGVEGTPDIIEDLIALNYLWRCHNKKTFLDNKIIVGTINRGGLSGVSWEMDDMCTCFTVERLAELKLDGIKFMLRINPDCENNKNTLRYCAEIVNKAATYKMPVFIEGLFIRTKQNTYEMQTDLESLIKTVGVVSALGCSSLQKWIELPLNKEYAKAVGASTCSFLVVPDEVGENKEEIISEYTAQIGVSHNVRGILLGRNVMYSQEDPLELAEKIAQKWHEYKE